MKFNEPSIKLTTVQHMYTSQALYISVLSKSLKQGYILASYVFSQITVHSLQQIMTGIPNKLITITFIFYTIN